MTIYSSLIDSHDAVLNDDLYLVLGVVQSLPVNSKVFKFPIVRQIWGGVGVGGVFFLLLFLASCSSQQASRNNPDSVYKRGEEAYRNERYLIAMERYREVKNRFPYSAKAVEAALRIADTYYAQEQYIEAESAYEVFRELHPTHSKSDFVQYRIGLSNYHQIPDNAARDLSSAHKTIEAFELLMHKFPSSKYVDKARVRLISAKRKLAEHENYVADFYYEREHYLSASYRYQSLLKNYPKLGFDEQALFRIAECYDQVKMYANAKNALRRLLKEYPESQYRSSAENLLQELNQRN